MAGKKLLLRTVSKYIEQRSLSISAINKQSLWKSDNIVKSPHKEIDIPNRTIPEHIWENLEKWADKTALVCGITNRSYTYHQLYKYTRNFATNLRKKLNITDGDIVCVMMPNSPEYAIVVFGIMEAGGIVTTINPIYTAYEVQRQIELSEAKLIISAPEIIPVVKDALSLSKKDLKIISVKGSSDTVLPGIISFEELSILANVDTGILKEVKGSSEDTALLPYSSGTTGLPKGVELTHKNIVANCMQSDVDTFRHYDETTKTRQDSALGILPFYHSYGLNLIMKHKLSIGFKIVTLPAFQPNSFINVLKEHPINVMYAAPPLILFIGSHTGVTKEYLAPLKTITSGAAPIPRNDINQVLEKLKVSQFFILVQYFLIYVYGLTETSPLATGMLPGSKEYSTAGYAVSNSELRIVNLEMKPLGPNEVGELLVRGPNVMKGYRNNPTASKDAISEDGWLKTGDLASIDENGAVTIADRIKELIKVKGYQVPPAELENVLKDHPDILDAAVIGIPDRKGGEMPKAFLVVREGRKADAEDVKAFVANRVAKYKQVKDVMFLDALPKNPSGKILRRVLKEKYS